LNALNAIVHPAVRKHFKSWAKEQKFDYVIQESAIIFEQENQDFYDKIVLVTAPQEERIARVLKRDSDQNRSKIEKRLANQMPDNEKKCTTLSLNISSVVATFLVLRLG